MKASPRLFQSSSAPSPCSRGLWLHGWLGNGCDAAPLQNALGNEIALLAPDLPGHGSQKDIRDPDPFLEELAELAAGCDWAAGYSMGGRLLMQAAARHPDAFPLLIIESAFLGYTHAEERQQRLKLDTGRAEELRERGLNRFQEEWYRLPLWGGWRPAGSRQGDPEALADALIRCSSGNQPDLRPWLRETTSRVLWLAGNRDPVYAEQADWVRTHTRHSVVTLDTGHNLHEQDPRGWADTILSFLHP